jgi:hypothetical protein
VSIILLGNDISVHAWAPFFIFFFGVFECFWWVQRLSNGSHFLPGVAVKGASEIDRCWRPKHATWCHGMDVELWEATLRVTSDISVAVLSFLKRFFVKVGIQKSFLNVLDILKT